MMRLPDAAPTDVSRFAAGSGWMIETRDFGSNPGKLSAGGDPHQLSGRVRRRLSGGRPAGPGCLRQPRKHSPARRRLGGSGMPPHARQRNFLTSRYRERIYHIAVRPAFDAAWRQ